MRGGFNTGVPIVGLRTWHNDGFETAARACATVRSLSRFAIQEVIHAFSRFVDGGAPGSLIQGGWYPERRTLRLKSPKPRRR